MHIVDGNDDDEDEKNNVQKNCLHFGASECQSHKCYLTSYAVERHLSSKLYRIYNVHCTRCNTPWRASAHCTTYLLISKWKIALFWSSVFELCAHQICILGAWFNPKTTGVFVELAHNNICPHEFQIRTHRNQINSI